MNEIPIKKSTELIGNFKVSMFTPDDILLINEGPSIRRRYLDMIISMLRPSYMYDLMLFNKILVQRNKLIKDWHYKKITPTQIEVWNEKLSISGARIIKMRDTFIKNISNFIKIHHNILTSEREEINIKYVTAFPEIEGLETSDIERFLLSSLEKSLERDIHRGNTSVGPHRDDFILLLDNKELKLFGSQGQKRTAILSLKLSEIDVIKSDTDERPILLLDDVMSELDKSRQNHLIEQIQGIQTFITTTESDIMNHYQGSEFSIFTIQKGEVFVGKVS